MLECVVSISRRGNAEAGALRRPCCVRQTKGHGHQSAGGNCLRPCPGKVIPVCRCVPDRIALHCSSPLPGVPRAPVDRYLQLIPDNAVAIKRCLCGLHLFLTPSDRQLDCKTSQLCMREDAADAAAGTGCADAAAGSAAVSFSVAEWVAAAVQYASSERYGVV